MIYAHLDAMDTNKNIPVVELPTAPIVRNQEQTMLAAFAACMVITLTIARTFLNFKWL